MSAFDQLHPALQHHIVNSLGWRSLRPFQEQCIEAILTGRHAIVLAPTAGGKTEAATFPVLSRMLTEGWSGLSVLYVCPIRALLNNLDTRLRHYCELVGRTSGLWHGDVGQPARRRMLREPPDCLLTTPESLELMLVSGKTDERALFAGVRTIIVDEIHAFAADDRGWHLLAVLERITRIAGREIQRIGLSATVGNPETLLHWLAGTCEGHGQLIVPDTPSSVNAEVMLDYVGSLANAATVISQLHRGEKRLVFCDSRSRVEELATLLRHAGVDTFVSHSSLSADERHRAESAFAVGTNCVIVATSALELGIDVGDLDRVIQIDSPASVAGFLQRMGRTGRRSGTRRNCLFLATSKDALTRAAGLIHLWAEGYIEPVTPPVRPLHVLAQQIMALALQEGGVGRNSVTDLMGGFPKLAGINAEDVEAVLAHMELTGILANDSGLLWFGQEGEQRFGRRNFMELLSVFTSPPLFSVRHGRTELGWVHQLSLVARQAEVTILLLGGRAWKVSQIDWDHRLVYVVPSDAPGRSRWLGSGQALSFTLCQAMQRIIAGRETSSLWSRRCVSEINRIREEFCWMEAESTAVTHEDEKGYRWWTFAGVLANAAIGATLRNTGLQTRWDNYSIVMEEERPLEEIRIAISSVCSSHRFDASAPVSDDAIEGLKFSSCLPPELAVRMLQERLRDATGVCAVLSRPVRFV